MVPECLAEDEPISPKEMGIAARSWRAIARRWDIIAILALATLLWLPRLSGPIDLRWDAGVYYILGTSLAQGHGYRILSEPGAPEAVQYPPLLPAIVALYQRALGSADPAVVAPWLRRSFAILFLVYALSVLALATCYLRPFLAVVATTLCLLHLWTIFLSDLLFAEIPFALLSVIFVLVATSSQKRRPWVRETITFVLAAAGFLFRTAGIVLFLAWIIEALATRKWRLAMLRAAMALLLVALWQLYVERTRRSDAYRHPAYTYQRAAYQNYNVTYADNMLLVDPFRPERGVVTKTQLARRLIGNIARMPSHLGQAISAPRDFWQTALRHRIGPIRLPAMIALLPILLLGLLVLAGCLELIRVRAWTIASVIILSMALICLTPWPEEFHRYLVPITPFLTLAALLFVDRLFLLSRARSPRPAPRFGGIVLAGLFISTLALQTHTAIKTLYRRELPAAALPAGAHFFAGPDWAHWKQAVDWIKARAADSDIIATTAPHQLYLQTGLRAVYPPFEANPALGSRELASVPVKYIIVDQFKYRNFSRRYALPAVESDPMEWPLVYSEQRTEVYQHANRSSRR